MILRHGKICIVWMVEWVVKCWVIILIISIIRLCHSIIFCIIDYKAELVNE